MILIGLSCLVFHTTFLPLASPTAISVYEDLWPLHSCYITSKPLPLSGLLFPHQQHHHQTPLIQLFFGQVHNIIIASICSTPLPIHPFSLFTMKSLTSSGVIAALTATAAVQAQTYSQDGPFYLKLKSDDSSVDGQYLSACHAGAAVESLCLGGTEDPAGADSASFFYNYTVYDNVPANSAS